MLLEPKYAFIAGATSKIGTAICDELSDFHLFRHGHTIRNIPAYICANLTISSGVQSAFSCIPNLDAFVSCVGGNHVYKHNIRCQPTHDNCTDMAQQEIEHLFAINYTANVLASQEAIKHMPQGGAIVFITSDVVGNPRPNGQVGIYASAKAALHEYMLHLANELTPRKISVNCVAPSGVGPNLVEPQEVASLVKYLCNNHKISGQVIRLGAKF